MVFIFRVTAVFLRFLDSLMLSFRKSLLPKVENDRAERKQQHAFERFDLDRDAGILLSNKVLEEMAISGFQRTDTSSEHEVLFASIAEHRGGQVRRILEVGTFEGHTTAYMSRVFPQSQIVTMDLPVDDKDFLESYGKGPRQEEIVKVRKWNLHGLSRVLFQERNSLSLFRDENKYDLIWLDGNHGYPVVAMDIINCLNLLTPEGLLVVDDVYVGLNPWQIDDTYTSNASYETLERLSEQGLIEYGMCLKRLDDPNNIDLRFTKHIAIVSKPE